MATTTRNCLICQKPMECIRASKVICSNTCHSKMHKKRVKLGLSNKDYLEILKQQQRENQDASSSSE